MALVFAEDVQVEDVLVEFVDKLVLVLVFNVDELVVLRVVLFEVLVEEVEVNDLAVDEVCVEDVLVMCLCWLSMTC